MTTEQKERIESYVMVLNPNIESGEVLDFVIAETVDRALIYLNEIDLTENLERIVAQVIVSVYKRTTQEVAGVAPEKSIKAVTDNGQKVEYSDSPAQFLGSTTDHELFTGFERLLINLRRPYVLAE